MDFNIGDKVIHWTHGLGEVVHIEEKTILSEPKKCYVVRTPELMIWIPIDDLQQCSLRLPTPPEEVVSLISILTSPSEKLLEDRVLRKNQLMAQMKDGQLTSICRVVRDLTHFGRNTKMNDQERSILERGPSGGDRQVHRFAQAPGPRIGPGGGPDVLQHQPLVQVTLYPEK